MEVGVEGVEDPDLVSVLKQRGDHRRADEAGAAGDEDTAHGGRHTVHLPAADRLYSVRA